MNCPRDLGQVDLWRESLELSLARRGRPKRSSVELYRLLGERDLLLHDVLLESAQYSQLRRRVADHPLVPRPATALGGVSALTLFAVMTVPGLLRGRSAGNQRVTHAAQVRGSGRAAKAATIASLRPRSVSDNALAGDITPVDFQTGVVSRVSSVSESVQQLQQLLGVAADGEFGPITLRAVKDFQASHGLVVDGIVGPATRAALGLPAGPVLRANPIYFPRAGINDSVRQMQRLLGVAADGEFGPITLRAVKDFQASHGLVVDGIVGPATRAALGLPAGPLLRPDAVLFPGAMANGYVNPLADASVTPERIDMGVDYAGTGTLTAIGPARVTFVGTSGTGWPGAFIEYQLLSGPDAGRYVYYAEGVQPARGIYVGRVLQPGQAVAYLIPGWSTGIEIGWGSGAGTSTLAQELGERTFPTSAGEDLSALIASLGGPPGIP
ncbi:MAG: peptidoglycan-binding domain-containing protein [Solirubrobacteraceae bacterium]